LKSDLLFALRGVSGTFEYLYAICPRIAVFIIPHTWNKYREGQHADEAHTVFPQRIFAIYLWISVFYIYAYEFMRCRDVFGTVFVNITVVVTSKYQP